MLYCIQDTVSEQERLALSPNSQNGLARQDRCPRDESDNPLQAIPQVTDLASRASLASLAWPAVQRLASTSHQAKRGWRVAIGSSLFPRGL